MTLDPIELQIVSGALRAACDEMGAALIKQGRAGPRIPTKPVEQIERGRGGKSHKTWRGPFRLPHLGGFDSR